uniref:Uncharacterized protein n=1 Tax=Anopheles epiroticus TaxID=199890 RepID=A0A182P4N4_9DIPT
MTERKFTRGLNKPGMAAQLRENISQVVLVRIVISRLHDSKQQTTTRKCFISTISIFVVAHRESLSLIADRVAQGQKW